MFSVAKGEIIDATTIASYMHAEKLTHFECSVTNRGSLSRPVMELVARMPSGSYFLGVKKPHFVNLGWTSGVDENQVLPSFCKFVMA